MLLFPTATSSPPGNDAYRRRHPPQRPTDDGGRSPSTTTAARRNRRHTPRIHTQPIPRHNNQPPDPPAASTHRNTSTRRSRRRPAQAGLKALNLRDVARFVHVESDYYDWPLEKRATRLAAPSPSHLCKTILFENTKYKPVDGVNELNPLYSRFYAVCVQYTDKLNAQRLGNFVKGLSGGLNKGREQPRKNFNMRVASESSNEALTGFEKGGVCPFGMLQRVPIILTENITKLDPPIMFLGAGHIDWKVGLPVDTFLDRQHDPKCFVADLS
ncbi:uncharacterized protein EV422DRAFT_125553 [Fimicolochytrium jonesii]|uniref:uncharacterized protein n=1 Tax=Fimicolochytrium jonesii TaxID=1396493 RepID=UPI0022FEED1C|nr:uncharacterized protein EV422DRAFT_125553 [Fimicolochytrium jonesii]KAI8818929.1 hypothetical protein EV422DRAFT_125553 [Fimicolochytrium jonesii]